AGGVHAQHGVPLVLPDPADAPRVARLPGVVDQDVDAAERRDRPRAQLARLVRLREIARLADGRALVALDLGDDLLEGLLAAAGDGHARALGGEHERGGAADAGAGAGDERDLTFECLHDLLGHRGVPRLRRGAPSVGGVGGPYRGPPHVLGTGQPRGLGARALDLVNGLGRAGRQDLAAGGGDEHVVLDAHADAAELLRHRMGDLGRLGLLFLFELLGGRDAQAIAALPLLLL